jgi:hypothetical protein
MAQRGERDKRKGRERQAVGRRLEMGQRPSRRGGESEGCGGCEGEGGTPGREAGWLRAEDDAERHSRRATPRREVSPATRG